MNHFVVYSPRCDFAFCPSSWPLLFVIYVRDYGTPVKWKNLKSCRRHSI
ncbi:unnamed protein product [Schistosoma rodhaini]|nr:unnamed protein product [Schistosoma rodhaini]